MSQRDEECKVLFVIAISIHTDAEPSVLKDGPKAQVGLDFDTTETYDGDGRVSWLGAHPPEGTFEWMALN